MENVQHTQQLVPTPSYAESHYTRVVVTGGMFQMFRVSTLCTIFPIPPMTTENRQVAHFLEHNDNNNTNNRHTPCCIFIHDCTVHSVSLSLRFESNLKKNETYGYDSTNQYVAVAIFFRPSTVPSPSPRHNSVYSRTTPRSTNSIKPRIRPSR